MQILANKDIRRFFGAVAVMILLILLFGMFLSQVIVNDFKAQMLSHDYETAGYLLEHGVASSEVSAAFTGSKTEENLSSGQAFLQRLGYKEGISNLLLPEANTLLTKYQVVFGLFTVLLGTIFFAAFFLYFKRQQKAVEKATACIDAFMSGDISARIVSEEEGSLSRLFASINSMATALNAHIETERDTRNFLKDTIADISHQLKTPLAALKMYNEIMQEESSNEDVIKKFSEKTAGALERMEILIKNLLKITKLDAGSIAMNKRRESIYGLMQEIVSSFETRAGKEAKSIILNGSDDSLLYCDRNWLTEAVGNLVKNALDHTKAGGIIEITWTETPAITRITVRDNGKGIHSEDIHHIFKRFYRSRFSQDIESVGLGLPLAKAIVEANNGTISVDSQAGKGSTFTLDFLKLTDL